ncbi:hypothetical protein BDF14DRAFT_1750040 [Spinellus fusiger]|nr:hypothetical protein BDF14DRAFT_1750040 [Spinellus fusiger]
MSRITNMSSWRRLAVSSGSWTRPWTRSPVSPGRVLSVTASPWSGHSTLRMGVRAISFKGLLSTQPTLATNNTLFHPLSESPIKELRDRSHYINKYGLCPVCDADDHKQPVFECPECGYPTHCSDSHYHQGHEEHKKVCSILREQCEDDHDLRSGRVMKEFDFPSAQGFDEAVNMSNWDVFFYTRSFPSMDSDRSMRHVSKLLTYPITVASILHQSCPYTMGKEMTSEGMRSISALRSVLYPHNEVAKDGQTMIRTDTIHLFIIGARAEATLPQHLWLQLAYLFPQTPFHIHFVGPDALPFNTEPYTEALNERVTFTYDNGLYEDYHDKRDRFDPYTNIFFLFSPGIGHEATRQGWQPSIKKLLETKCPVFLTGYDEADMASDIKAVEEDYAGDFDWVLKPTANAFRSLKRDVDLTDLRHTIHANWGIWGIRGKRYDVTHKEDEDE